MARLSSSLTSSNAPTSSQVVSGTVANPSRLADGCTSCRACCGREGREGGGREVERRRGGKGGKEDDIIKKDIENDVWSQ